MCQWNWIVSQLNIVQNHSQEVQKHSKLLQNVFLDLLSAQEPVRGLGTTQPYDISNFDLRSSMFFFIKKNMQQAELYVPL